MRCSKLNKARKSMRHVLHACFVAVILGSSLIVGCKDNKRDATQQFWDRIPSTRISVR